MESIESSVRKAWRQLKDSLEQPEKKCASNEEANAEAADTAKESDVHMDSFPTECGVNSEQQRTQDGVNSEQQRKPDGENDVHAPFFQSPELSTDEVHANFQCTEYCNDGAQEQAVTCELQDLPVAAINWKVKNTFIDLDESKSPQERNVTAPPEFSTKEHQLANFAFMFGTGQEFGTPSTNSNPDGSDTEVTEDGNVLEKLDVSSLESFAEQGDGNSECKPPSMPAFDDAQNVEPPSVPTSSLENFTEQGDANSECNPPSMSASAQDCLETNDAQNVEPPSVPTCNVTYAQNIVSSGWVPGAWTQSSMVPNPWSMGSMPTLPHPVHVPIPEYAATHNYVNNDDPVPLSNSCQSKPNKTRTSNGPECLKRGLEKLTSTTVFLRHLPNNMKRKQLMEAIDDFEGGVFWGKYDFVYLAFDWEKGTNLGYAFINFMHIVDADYFQAKFEGHKLKESSKKKCEVKNADAQGLEKCLQKFKGTTAESSDSHPVNLQPPRQRPIQWAAGHGKFPGPPMWRLLNGDPSIEDR